MSRLNEWLDQLIDYGFTNLIGSTLEDTPPFKEIRKLAEEMDRVLVSPPLSGAQRLVAERAAADPMVVKPAVIDLTPERPWAKAAVILSELHDVPGHSKPLIVGWTTCAKCLLHVLHCDCAAGPTEPTSVRQWRESSGHVPDPKASAVVPTAARSLPEVMAGLTLGAEVEGGHIVMDGAEPLSLSGVGQEALDRAVSDALTADQPCKVCGIEVTTEGPDYNGDKNDDGTWTCLADQGGAAVTG